MIDEVQSVIEKWQSDKRLTSLGEAKVQQVIVLPILRRLGWDPDNDHEVHPQYPVADGWVDYALLIGNAPKVFIEVKKGGESLERHQEQLLNYSFKRGVRMSVLTNGATWWFYLPLQEGSWEDRKFHVAEYDKQNAAEIAQIFVNLLRKDYVGSGEAIQNAEKLRKKHQIAETLPRAWNQLVNNTIANLLTTRTEELCGHKPDKNEVDQFLSKVRFPQKTSPTEPVSPPEPTVVPEPVPQPNLSGRSERTTCRAFTFCGNRHEVSSCRDMLVRLCEVVHRAQSDRFDEILNLRGTRGKVYFSKDSSELHRPMQISGTNIFVTDLYPKTIKQTARRLITHFGYNENDLSFE